MVITVALVSSLARRSLAAQTHFILRSHLAPPRPPAQKVERPNDMKGRHGIVSPLTAAYTCRVVGFPGLY